MASRIRLALLGPMRAWRDGEEIDLGTPQQRAVLGWLALREGRPARIDEVVDAVWGDQAPADAKGTVRTYIYRLRRVLRPVDGLVSVSGGYALREVSTDLGAFGDLVEQARELRTDGDLPGAAGRLAQALKLWRGSPLSGVRGYYAIEQREWLEEVRLAALEARFGLDLELGRHLAIVMELTAAVKARPLREPLRELLMLALYRSGRQADALAAYQELRVRLSRELGIGPGANLQRLHQRILQADPGLLGVPTVSRPVRSPAPVPTQLPPAPGDFVGRTAEVAEMTEVLTQGEPAPVVAVTGLAGIGKTALALHVGHQVRSSYPDGQVYADLGAASGCPADPSQVLDGFLYALGADPATLPRAIEVRAALWRTLLADRKMLIVLDDAYDGTQVRYLLPSAPGSAVIITYSYRMPDLVCVRWLKLNPLSRDEAVQMLAAIAGARRVQAEPGPSARLVALASCLPLAIRTVAARALARPLWSLRQIGDHMAGCLRHPVIAYADGEVVYAALKRSESWLTAEMVYAFRIAGLLGYSTITVEAAAALLDVPPIRARAILESIADVHLLDALPSGAYRYLPLVKIFARRQALAAYGPAACQSALQRLIRPRCAPLAQVAPA